MASDGSNTSTSGLGAFLFRHRGLVPILPVAFVLMAADPRPQLIGVGLVMMAVGEAIRLWAAAYLGPTARSAGTKTHKLVTRGPYAFTRHPLYAGNLALTIGYCLVSGAGFPWFVGLVAVGFVVLYGGHARREERAMAQAFSGPYARYRKEVPGLRWRLRAASVPDAGDTGVSSLRRALRVEALTLNAEFWLLVVLWARIRWLDPLGLG